MGAALATHRADSGSAHWPLLREYLSQSLRSLDECAGVFLGSSSSDDDVDSADECDHRPRHRRGSAGGAALHRPAPLYPRFLTREQFDEVFGMLVADAEPHFAFFRGRAAGGAAATAGGGGGGDAVCAHQVFCGLALLARADLHAKVQFLLRLYATDAHGELPVERRLLLLRDFLAALTRVLGLAEPVENAVVSYLEREFLSGDDKGLSTGRELYDFCFSTARVSGFLHEIQSAVADLSKLRDKEATGRLQHAAAAVAGSSASAAKGGGRLKLLNRGATMLQLTNEALLWSMRARDLSCLWRHDCLALSEDATVGHALSEMKQHSDADAVLVTSVSCGYAALLTTDDFHAFLADLLPEDAAAATSMGDFMRLQVAKSCAAFVSSSLRSMVDHLQETTATLSAKPRSVARTAERRRRHQCISADECFFNAVLRLACGAQALAVLQSSLPQATQQVASSAPRAEVGGDPLLGCISVFDALEWLLEDLSLLNGKERFAVASFPSFYCSPASVSFHSGNGSKRPRLLDAIATMREQKTTGVLVHSTGEIPATAHTLSTGSLRDVFASEPRPGDTLIDHGNDEQCYAPIFDALTPLQVLCDRLPAAFAPGVVVSGDDSIARVVHTMVATRSRRVYISGDDAAAPSLCGVIRATDVLRLLLQEQHRKPRFM